MKFEVYQDQNRDFRWRLRSSNGSVVADSAEGYRKRGDVRASINTMQAQIAGAHVVDLEVPDRAPETPAAAAPETATSPAPSNGNGTDKKFDSSEATTKPDKPDKPATKATDKTADNGDKKKGSTSAAHDESGGKHAAGTKTTKLAPTHEPAPPEYPPGYPIPGHK